MEEEKKLIDYGILTGATGNINVETKEQPEQFPTKEKKTLPEYFPTSRYAYLLKLTDKLLEKVPIDARGRAKIGVARDGITKEITISKKVLNTFIYTVISKFVFVRSWKKGNIIYDSRNVIQQMTGDITGAESVEFLTKKLKITKKEILQYMKITLNEKAEYYFYPQIHVSARELATELYNKPYPNKEQIETVENILLFLNSSFVPLPNKGNETYKIVSLDGERINENGEKVYKLTLDNSFTYFKQGYMKQPIKGKTGVTSTPNSKLINYIASLKGSHPVLRINAETITDEAELTEKIKHDRKRGFTALERALNLLIENKIIKTWYCVSSYKDITRTEKQQLPKKGKLEKFLFYAKEKEQADKEEQRRKEREQKRREKAREKKQQEQA